MLISEALARLRLLVNETSASNSFYLDAQLYQHLDSGQNLIVDLVLSRLQMIREADRFADSKVLRPLNIKDSTVATTIGASLQEYTLPTDYLYTDYAEYSNLATGGTRYPAVKTNFAQIGFEMQNTYLAYTGANPCYYIRDGKIGFYPQPSGVNTDGIAHYYWKKPLTISSGNSANEISLAPEAHDAVVLFGFYYALSQDAQYEVAQSYYNQAIEIIKQLT